MAAVSRHLPLDWQTGSVRELDVRWLVRAGEATPPTLLPLGAGGNPTNTLKKSMTFTGVTVKLFEGDPRPEEGVGGGARLSASDRRDDAPAPKRWDAALSLAANTFHEVLGSLCLLFSP